MQPKDDCIRSMSLEDMFESNLRPIPSLFLDQPGQLELDLYFNSDQLSLIFDEDDLDALTSEDCPYDQ